MVELNMLEMMPPSPYNYRMEEIIAIILALVILAGTVFLFFYIMTGPPYLPSKQKKVEKMAHLLEIQPGQKAIDIGSGDGRIVIALAKAGAEAHGVEINPALVWLSRRNIKKAGLQENAFIHSKSFWRQNFSDFDIVTLYGMPHTMRRLEGKLMRELKPGAKVACNTFKLPTWRCEKEEDGVYLYVKRT